MLHGSVVWSTEKRAKRDPAAEPTGLRPQKLQVGLLSYRKQIAHHSAHTIAYVESINSNSVTWKSRLRITQGYWMEPLERSYTTYY